VYVEIGDDAAADYGDGDGGDEDDDAVDYGDGVGDCGSDDIDCGGYADYY